jgi:hypothetical protein
VAGLASRRTAGETPCWCPIRLLAGRPACSPIQVEGAATDVRTYACVRDIAMAAPEKMCLSPGRLLTRSALSRTMNQTARLMRVMPPKTVARSAYTQ